MTLHTVGMLTVDAVHPLKQSGGLFQNQSTRQFQRMVYALYKKSGGATDVVALPNSETRRSAQKTSPNRWIAHIMAQTS